MLHKNVYHKAPQEATRFISSAARRIGVIRECFQNIRLRWLVYEISQGKGGLRMMVAYPGDI